MRQNNTDYSQVAQLTQKKRRLHLTELKFTQILPLTINHPENLIWNTVIRLQVNEEFSQKSISKEINMSHVYHPIEESFSNTMIPFDWIEKYAFQYQSMLKRIADYLLSEKIR